MRIRPRAAVPGLSRHSGGRRESRRAWPVVVGLVAFLPLSGHAQEIFRTPFEDVAPGTPAIGGAALAHSKTYVGDADRFKSDLVPLYLFKGERTFALGNELGLHLLDAGALSVDLLGRYRFTQLRPDELDLDGIEPRDQTVEAGVRMAISGAWGRLRATWLADTLGRHNGQTTEASYGFPMRFGSMWVTPWLSWEWQSAALANYYFRVTPEESGASGLPSYVPGAAGILGWGVNTAYQVSDNVLVFANAGQYRPDDAIADSPLSYERTQNTVYAGLAVSFGTIEGYRREDRSPAGLWTWRINAGYLAHGTIVGDISEGDLSRSDKAETPIAGLTLSRLIRPGPRVDVYGRASVFRHFEDGLQDDFFSYAAYITAIGKGYLGWSPREAFRFGFGFGFSYADQVPAVEQIKQAEDDKNTNRLLTYLELLVDTPLANFTHAESMKNCYIGATVVHRSGIFGYSSLLGNVAGGSDWITASLECKR